MNDSTQFRPHRSCLYMPGANARALGKAKTLAADMLIFDLEDAVAPDAKTTARETVAEAVTSRAYAHREVVVRINELSSEWGQDDLTMAASVGADGVLAPKVTCGNDILALEQALDDRSAPKDLGLWVMIEMPAAILNIHEIAKASENTRLKGFVVGTNDLAKEINAVPTAGRDAFLTALQQTILAARAYGLIAIDGVFNNIKDEDGLINECEQGRIFGYDGKSLIHPSQLEATNRIFSPDIAEVEHARDVIAAFSLPENQGQGVIKVNGKMTELLHLEQAQRLVSIQEAIEQLPQA